MIFLKSTTLLLFILLIQSEVLSSPCEDNGGICTKTPECGLDKECEYWDDFLEACIPKPIKIKCLHKDETCCSRDVYSDDPFNDFYEDDELKLDNDEFPSGEEEDESCAGKSITDNEEIEQLADEYNNVDGEDKEKEEDEEDKKDREDEEDEEDKKDREDEEDEEDKEDEDENALMSTPMSKDVDKVTRGPCKKKWKCGGFNKRCYQASTCPNDYYHIANGCKTQNGSPACRCCGKCRKRAFQCLNEGRCTTQSCASHEVMFSNNNKCKSSSCHCCQPCRPKFGQCLGGSCTKTSCGINEAQHLGKCTHDDCHCCKPCQKKLFNCLFGKCQTEECKTDEAKLLGRCTHTDCHCCEPCRKKLGKCLFGKCTTEACKPLEVTYTDQCAHNECHCCGPCKKQFGRCLFGRCTKEKCKEDEETIIGECKTQDCHCCRKSCPDSGCKDQGGVCRQSCLGSELGFGLCSNNCQCCKKFIGIGQVGEEISLPGKK